VHLEPNFGEVHVVFYKFQNVPLMLQLPRLALVRNFTNIAYRLTQKTTRLAPAMTTTSRQQPAWQAPKEPTAKIPELAIYNSLTRKKERFVPRDPEGKKVTWYCCGPTVYDDAHLGHARNYVTTDIIRRIMRDYFKFDMKFVMNITDVDDKIILRGRQQHLLAKFKEENRALDKVLEPATTAYRNYAKKNVPELPEDILPNDYSAAVEKAYGGVLKGESLAGDGSPPGDKEAKLKMHLRTLATASEALTVAEQEHMPIDTFYHKVEDILLPYLDSLYGSSINAEDHSVFTRLTKKYEERFMDDMRALNCSDPDQVTRVTEYGAEIVKYVEEIVRKGFGYATTDGSVYFDIDGFEAAGNHYARLEPWNKNDKELQADGEGSLAKKTTEKKSDADFALWKSSKPGEPSWPSPWGPGRPGWHIECSVMASDVLGETLDIHSGGIDLAFPHHDNELAQSEAYWVKKEEDGKCLHTHQWVNYFMHMGHLSIQGSKMSKSLKNFTTIREALSRGDWTPRALRVVFLLGGWKDGVEITDDLVKTGASWEDKVNNFFLKARSVEQNQPEHSHDGSVAHGTPQDSTGDDTLLSAQSKAQVDMYEALCDSFNTSKALRVIADLITEYNSANKATVTDETTMILASWITEMVKIFGLESDSHKAIIGWSGIDIPESAAPFVYPASTLRDEIRKRAKSGDTSPAEMEHLSHKYTVPAAQPAAAIPYAEVLSQFQEDIRNLAKAQASAKEYLKLCDDLRDVILWDQGIYLEDSLEEGQPAMVRPLDKGLIAARAEKEQREKDRLAAKAKRDEEAAKKAEKGKLSPLEMFKTDEFTAWDGEGMPLKDGNGEELNKSRLKKLKKQWDVQKKAHDAWKATQAL